AFNVFDTHARDSTLNRTRNVDLYLGQAGRAINLRNIRRRLAHAIDGVRKELPAVDLDHHAVGVHTIRIEAGDDQLPGAMNWNGVDPRGVRAPQNLDLRARCGRLGVRRRRETLAQDCPAVLGAQSRHTYQLRAVFPRRAPDLGFRK